MEHPQHRLEITRVEVDGVGVGQEAFPFYVGETEKRRNNRTRDLAWHIDQMISRFVNLERTTKCGIVVLKLGNNRFTVDYCVCQLIVYASKMFKNGETMSNGCEI